MLTSYLTAPFSLREPLWGFIGWLLAQACWAARSNGRFLLDVLSDVSCLVMQMTPAQLCASLPPASAPSTAPLPQFVTAAPIMTAVVTPIVQQHMTAEASIWALLHRVRRRRRWSQCVGPIVTAVATPTVQQNVIAEASIWAVLRRVWRHKRWSQCNWNLIYYTTMCG